MSCLQILGDSMTTRGACTLFVVLSVIGLACSKGGDGLDVAPADAWSGSDARDDGNARTDVMQEADAPRESTPEILGEDQREWAEPVGEVLTELPPGDVEPPDSAVDVVEDGGEMETGPVAEVDAETGTHPETTVGDAEADPVEASSSDVAPEVSDGLEASDVMDAAPGEEFAPAESVDTTPAEATPETAPEIVVCDGDGDGYDAESCGGNDCDDTSAAVHPGAFDAPGDGLDADCDGVDGVPDGADLDGDGWPSTAFGGTDCDDGDAATHPGALDLVAGWCPADEFGFQAERIRDFAFTRATGLTRDGAGRWHAVLEQDWDGHAIEHALREEGGWSLSSLVAVASTAVNPAIAAVGESDAIVAYLDRPTSLSWAVSAATWSEGVWSIEQIDKPWNLTIYETAIAADVQGRRSVAYVTGTGTTFSLWMARRVDGVWYKAEAGPAYRRRPAVALDAAGVTHVAYVSPEFAPSYATNEAGGWSTQVIDEAVDSLDAPSIAVDANGNVWLAYRDSTHGYLKVASRIGGAWALKVVDDLSSGGFDTGEDPSVAARADGTIEVLYHDGVLNRTRLATHRDGVWSLSTLDLPIRPDRCDALRVTDDGGLAFVCTSYPDRGVYLVTGRAGCHVAADATDRNCDGLDGLDADGDNHASTGSGGDDCDDGSVTVFPGASDVATDGLDQDCDGVDGLDLDADGFADVSSGGDDCNDGDASVHPGAPDAVAEACPLPRVTGWTAGDVTLPVNPNSATAVVDRAGHEHLVYQTTSPTALRYATDASGAWQSTVIPAQPGGYYPSIGVGPDGSVSVAYRDGTSGTLTLATQDPASPGTWQTTTPGGTVGDARVRLSIDGTRTRHLAYVRKETNGVTTARYLTDASGTWVESVVDPMHYATQVGLALDQHGGALVAYLQNPTTNGGTYCALWVGRSAGEFADRSYVVEPADCTQAPTVAIDAVGRAHVAYISSTNSEVRYATDASGQWQTETASAPYQREPRLVLDAVGRAFIAHHSTETKQSLTTNQSGVWETFTVATTSAPSFITELAWLPSGDLRAFYHHDATSGGRIGRALAQFSCDAPATGQDTNCDGVPGVDADGDGFASLPSGGTDCDDASFDVHPGATDVSGDGVDSDCDGLDD
jgi:hypothetical protein